MIMQQHTHMMVGCSSRFLWELPQGLQDRHCAKHEEKGGTQGFHLILPSSLSQSYWDSQMI